MLPSEVYTLIREQCNETDTTFWGESEVYRYMSIGESIIAEKIGLIEASATTVTVSGTRGYSFTSGTLVRVTWDEVRLERVEINSLGDIEGESYGGVTVQGNPRYYYVWNNEINLSPIPNSAKTLKKFYRTYPEAVTTASSSWSIPNDYGQHVADYALFRMFIKDQEMTNEAMAFKESWEDSLKTITHDWKQRKYRDLNTMVNTTDDPIDSFE